MMTQVGGGFPFTVISKGDYNTKFYQYIHCTFNHNGIGELPNRLKSTSFIFQTKFTDFVLFLRYTIFLKFTVCLCCLFHSVAETVSVVLKSLSLF